MSDVNRQWLLNARPVGMVKESDFKLNEAPIPVPADGQVLVRNTHFAFEPAMRGWMEDRPSYIPPVGIGEVMRGNSLGEVVESKLEGYEPGDRVSGMTGWQEYAIGDRGLTKLPPEVQPELAMSILGATGITAYFGMLEVAEPKPGDTVVVSGAAGATGSVAGQIAKIEGCRVIGIAGGAEKCRWLTEEGHFDAAIDYKNEDVGARLDELCPDGIDVYFDNVGGDILDAVLARIAQNARIALCGGISAYNLEETPPGPRNYFNLVIQRGTMRGFIVMDYFHRFAEAAGKLLGWVAEGKIAWQADVQEGFENAPKALQRLFTGANVGKQLLKL